MATDTTRDRWPSQQHRLEFDLGTARQWYLADVDADGSDGGNFPVPADAATPAVVAAFDGVSDVGTIRGSIAAGGFSAELTIPRYPAAFADWFECTLLVRGRLGGVPGIPGAAGTELGRVVLFKGHMRTVEGARTYGTDTTRFPVESSVAFLRESGFSRGWDHAAGTPHGAPGTAHAVIRHLLLGHTNWYPRSNYGIYVPDHALTAWSHNEGGVYGLLQSLADNFAAGEGQVYCRRNDDLVIGAHPNLAPDLHPNLNDPIVDLDDGLVDEWRVPETPPRACASVQLVAQRSDQTEYASPVVYQPGGLGSRVKRTLRTDDTALVDALAARLLKHLNRRFQGVRATMSGLVGVTIDLGDVVTATTRLPQRGIAWAGKKFLVTEVAYRPDIQRGTFATDLTLDEIVV